MNKPTNISDVLKAGKWQGSRSPSGVHRKLCEPDCEICGGVGFVRYDVPRDDIRFGRLFPCPNLPADSSIHDGHGLTHGEIESLTWSNMEIRENIEDAMDLLKELLERGTGMGYLFGGPGLAKTALLKIFCAEYFRKHKKLFKYTSQKNIMDDMRLAYDDDEPNRKIVEKQNKYNDFPLLAIDEVTTERSTEFKVEQFFHLVNSRHEAGTERGEGKITVMVGNIMPDKLDYRVHDRLMDGRNFIFRLIGESYRPGLKWSE